MRTRKFFTFSLLSLLVFTLFACTPKTHTITIDANNGSAITTQSVVNGAALPTVASPTKQHFTFDYWYSSNASQAYNFATPVTASFTLTAKYSAIVFTATYNPNNGAQNTVVNVNSGATLTQPSDPLKTDYTFNYWYATDINTPFVFTGAITSNITLTAKYSRTTFAVILNADNGSQNVSQNINSGEAFAEPTDPVKEHYTFDYWYSSDINTAYDFATLVRSNLTLTAKYSPIVFVVTYNHNNGDGDTTQNVNSGQLATVPTAPVKAHYTFNYWYITDANVEFVFTTPIVSNLTLNAKYTMNVYTITLNPNNGEESSQQVLNSGSLVSRPVSDPSKPDNGTTIFTFDYWYKDNDVNHAYDFNSIVTSNFILTAKYTATITYLVTFDPNNGEDTFSQVVNESEPAIQPNVPVKTNYTFQHWYITDPNVAYNFATLITGNVNLIAKYEITVYTVTFNSANGVANNEVPVNSGTAVSQPLTDPVKPDEGLTSFEFIGWFKTSSPTAYNFSDLVVSDIILTAHYNSIYTVTFDYNNEVDPDTTQSITSGGVATAPSAPTKANYTFNYWYASDINTPFVFSTLITDNTTLTAKYTIITYTVTFDADNGSQGSTVNVNSGTAVSEPLTDPVKDPSGITSYTFDYWYSSDINTPFNFNSLITSNMTIYAKYTETNEMDANVLSATPSWGAYLDNISPIGKTDVQIFAGPDKNYSVGNDNQFILPVSALYVVDQDHQYELTIYNRTLTLYYKNSEEQWVLVGNNSLYITEDEHNSNRITFNETAIGKVFKIVITLSGIDPDSVELSNIEVADGYNIYTEEDLLSVSGYSTGVAGGGTSVFDRRTVIANSIFMHKDINLTVQNLPSELLETNLVTAEGPYPGTYLLDDIAIFTFSAGVDQTFLFNGNFFTIDGNAIPKIIRDGGEPYATPETAFGVNSGLLLFTDNLSSHIENVNIIGNSGYSNQTIEKGGYNAVYAIDNPTNYFTNVHVRYAQVAYNLYTAANSLVYNKNYLDYCVLNNMFSIGIYNSDSDLDIKHSILKTFGGMAITLADYKNNPGGGQVRDPLTPMNLTIDANTVIDSNVVGNEAWFNVNGFTNQAMQLKGQINTFLANFGKTIINPDPAYSESEYMNFISIETIENPFDPNYAGCSAYANVTVGSGDTFELNPISDTEYGPLSATIYNAFLAGGAMIETSLGGLIYDYTAFTTNVNKYPGFISLQPAQVMPYIANLSPTLQQALFQELTVFDVNVAAAAYALQSNPADQTAWALLSTMPAKILETYNNTMAPASAGNNYIFVKTRPGTSWMGILVEMYDLVS